MAKISNYTVTKKAGKGTPTMTLGEKITLAREVLKLSRTQLSDKIGAKGTQLYNWEKNIRKAPADMMLKLADALGVDLTYLLEDNAPTEDPNYLQGDGELEPGNGEEDSEEGDSETSLAIPEPTAPEIPEPGTAIDVAWSPAQPFSGPKALTATASFEQARRALDAPAPPMPLFPEPPPAPKKPEEQLIFGFPGNLADLAADMEAVAILIERERAQLLIAKKQYQDEKELHGIDELEKELKEKKDSIAANQLRLEEMAKALRKKKAEAA